MDSQKQKLKNRLNLKYQPLPSHRYSVKKLSVDKKALQRSTDRDNTINTNNDPSLSRMRSISQIRLPSLQKKSALNKLIQQKERSITISDVKPKLQSLKIQNISHLESKLNLTNISSNEQINKPLNIVKQTPKLNIKVQSKLPIHQTLTYLIKNQILSIPKIVALLHKSHSQEFLYMRVRGIYEYQVCDQKDKGESFVTVSRNGMVTEGQLIPLQTLVHQFQLYSKLRKINFFKHYTFKKFIDRWDRGSKKANFIQNKNKVYRLLNLDNSKLLQWNRQLKQSLTIYEAGGYLNSNWPVSLAQLVAEKRAKAEKRLTKICYQMIQNFDLPISDSSELMNKVLGNLNNLNLKFQNKIRIERQLEIFYRLARHLQFYFIYTIGQYVLRHIQKLFQKVSVTNLQYCKTILEPLLQLDINQEKFSKERQKILVNAPVAFQIEYYFSLNKEISCVQISPTTTQIHQKFLNALRQFMRLIEAQSFTLVRTKNFQFVLNVVNKAVSVHSEQKNFTIKDYIYTLSDYYPFLENLEIQIYQFQQTVKKKISILDPFVEIYKAFKVKNQKPFVRQCFFQDINKQFTLIDQKIKFCNKINDGEYFIFGYLKQNQVRDDIIQEILNYQKNILNFIPILNQENKKKVRQNIQQHLKHLNIAITSPDSFIQVAHQSQIAQQKLPEYDFILFQLQRINQLYLKRAKKDAASLAVQKGLMTQIKNKLRNFKQVRQNLFIFYKRELQSRKKSMLQKIQKLDIKQDSLYQLSQNTQKQYKIISQIIQFLKKTHGQLRHLNQLESYFALKETIVPKLEMLIVEYQNLQDIWKMYHQWSENQKSFFKKYIFKIPAKKEVLIFEIYLRKLEKYSKNIQYFQICKYLLQKISIYVESMQFISQTLFQDLRPKDLEQMNSLLTKETEKQIRIKDLTLQNVIEMKLFKLRHLLEEICFKCRKELQIKQMIQDFQVWWRNLKLQGKSLEDYPLIIIFNYNDNIRKEIDQYTTVLLNILNHKYGAFIRKQCNQLLKKMQMLSELLSSAIQHQQKFLNLYPILTSKYAQQQLSQQYKKFNQILNKTMKNVRWLIKPTQNLNEATKAMLSNHIKNFDAISKILTDFLQKKRVKFQRFYFLQDNEMLQVLVGTGNQNNVFRMFQGIKCWKHDQNGVKIGVQGVGGETLLLKGWSYKSQQPQVVFKSLEDSIKLNLNSLVRTILHNYQSQMKQLKNLYKNVPWMCIYTVQMIMYTKQIQLNCFYDNISFQMQKQLIRQTIRDASSNPQTHSNYITLMLFLLNFTQELQKQQVTSVFNFQWHSFLKYYHQHNNVVMRALGSEHQWGGEYQGLWNLMINTSDIRRANACVLGNLKYANGVLLQGPSGTGKTQSLKQLARCMAKYCVLFNCSNEVNIRTLQKLLSGLCYTASWICLDEINRLTSQIMSVVANQINTVKNALVSDKQFFNFMGKTMQLKKGIGVFSTMNPIYLKRAKLTQNLKSYFRIISVNVPDYQKIMQVLLFGLNYSNATLYSKNIAKLFKNLSFQLQDHLQYDFGLRSMKTFISNLSKAKNTIKNQQQRIVHGLYETFYSKLDPKDIKTFQKVVKDISGFNLLIQKSEKKINSIRESPQIGTIIMGPTSCKSSIITEYLLSLKNETVDIQIFNANSVQIKYFLGQNFQGKWTPGIVQKMARKSLQFQKQIHILILDNMLKSQIIQNFNTLLDESKLLTLSNGTRLKIHNNFKMIMQTPDLTMTSPATITRCNVIYVNEQDLQKTKLIKSIFPSFSYENISILINILMHFNFQQIRRIGKIYPLIWNKQIQYKQNIMKKMEISSSVMNLNDKQIKGLQKLIFYVIQLLGITQKVRSLIHREVMIPNKKSLYEYYLSFQKLSEGEYVQLVIEKMTIKNRFNYYIPTISGAFSKIMNKNAVLKNYSVLWKGESMIGKTTVIKRNIKEIIQQIFPKQKKLIKIPIDKNMQSKNIIQCLQERLSVKNDMLVEEIIIYIDNVHLAQEQPQQLFRFITQFCKIYLPKMKDIVKMPTFSVIADSNNIFKAKQARLNRHFAQFNFPESSQNQTTSIYSTIIKQVVSHTKTSTQFKENLYFELDKFSVFLVDFIKKVNSKKLSFLQQRSKFKVKNQISFINLYNLSFINSLKNLQILSQKFIKQPADFIEFMLSEVRKAFIDMNTLNSEERILKLDILKLAFNQSYKQNYVDQYNKTLKSYNGAPQQVSFYSGLMSDSEEKINEFNNFKNTVYKRLSDKHYLSEFMLKEIISIMRILEYAGGNFILVGPQGVGKKSLFKMGAQLSNCQYKDVELIDQNKISEVYFSILKQSFTKQVKIAIVLDANSKNAKYWLDLLEKVVSGYPLKYLFNSQHTDEAFLMMQHFDDLNYEKNIRSYETVIDDFFQYSRKDVHLLLSCRQQLLKDFIQKYHYLRKQSSIRFIPQFPSQSITQISTQILQSKMEQKINSKRLSSVFLKMYEEINQLIEQNFKTKGYSHFKHNSICHFKLVEYYCLLQQTILQKIKAKEDILNRSIMKIQQTSKKMRQIQKSIIQMQPQIQKKQEKLLSTAPLLQTKKYQSEQIKSIVMSQKKELQMKKSEMELNLKQIQEKIKQSQPHLQQANQSLLTIKRAEVSQIKNNPNPHPLVKFTLQNLTILLGENQSWQNIKKNLSDPNLMLRIKNCSPKQEDYLKVKNRIEANPDWNFDSVSKVAFGTRYLCKWIKGIVKFNDIKLKIERQKKQVQLLKNQVNDSETKVQQKYNELLSMQAELNLVEQHYQKNKGQLLSLKESVQQDKRKFQSAQKIKKSLQLYVKNWNLKIQEGRQFRKNIQGYCTLLTFFTKVYPYLQVEERQIIQPKLKTHLQKALFSFNQKFDCLKYLRQQMIHFFKKEIDLSFQSIQKNQISIDKIYDVSSLSFQDLGNQKLVQLIFNFDRRPIIFDPDNQAIKWIQAQMVKKSGNIDFSNKIMITKQSFTASIKNVQIAIKQGYLLILLIEDALDQFTSDILNSKIINSANRVLLEYNKNLFYMSPNFKIILCNRSRKPDPAINFFINHQVINFQITKTLLQNQLLHQVLKIQNQQIFNSKVSLQIERMKNQESLINIQETIINSLIHNKRQLIQDDEFINLLTQGEEKTLFLGVISKQLNDKISGIQRNTAIYTNLCNEAANVFMSLKFMSRINSFFSWNVQIFFQYFSQSCIDSISESLFAEDNDEQYEFNTDHILNYEYDNYIGHGNSRATSALSYISAVTSKVIYEQRKDDFQEQEIRQSKTNKLTVKLDNLIQRKEVVVQIQKKGTMNKERQNNIIKKLVSILKNCFNQNQKKTWAIILSLIQSDPQDIKILFTKTSKRQNIKDFIEGSQISKQLKDQLTKPQINGNRLVNQIVIHPNPFLKYSQFRQIDILILCKLFKPQRFNEIILQLIKLKGYQAILQYQKVSVNDWFVASDNIHPILLIMGQDPMSQLSQYFAKKNYKRVILLAMGQGQSKIAQLVIQRQSRKQNIVIIHNLHISPQFFPFLSKTLQQFQTKKPHRNFRLILITSMIDNFSTSIASTCHKYYINQPNGVKNQMRYLYEHLPLDVIQPNHKKLVYSLCLFHSVINELLKYKPYGWNIKYDFDTSDFINAIKILKQTVQSPLNIKNYQCNIDSQQLQEIANPSQIDFKALMYLIGEVNYIGKLADDLDRKKMRIFIKKFLNKQIVQNENFKFDKNYYLPKKFTKQEIEKAIQLIPQNDPKFYGIQQDVKPYSQTFEEIIACLSKAFWIQQTFLLQNLNKKDAFIQFIDHPMEFINSQIQIHNEKLLNKTESDKNSYSKQQRKGQYEYLSKINNKTKVFDLRSFSNPQQFFVQIQKQASRRLQVSFEQVDIIWSLISKQNIPCYGIMNLKLQGANINKKETKDGNNYLDIGFQQFGITLYIYGSLKKKDKEINKKLVSIPLYLKGQRQGQINSYGDNTNLLTMVKIQAIEPEQFWILRNTAFIADP